MPPKKAVVGAVNKWKVRSRQYDFEWEGSLIVGWEAAGDPMSDEYTPAETSAAELFAMWVKWTKENYPDGFVPLSWYVESPGNQKFERLPFQYDHLTADKEWMAQHPDYVQETFLTFFTWPTHAVTRKPLNWLHLPVEDKLWRKGNAAKGGFIQEHTGWKPSIYQTHVFIPSLVEARNG